MTSPRIQESFDVLEKIVQAVGLSPNGAEPIRLAENDLWRLPGQVVVRIARRGQSAAAAREVQVTRWLAQNSIPAVRPLDIDQPVTVNGRTATFWEELPPHRAGDESDLAPLLRRLHELPPPPFALGEIAPFVRIADRIKASQSASREDQAWLLRRLEDLQAAWTDLPQGLRPCVVHGDAWGGNTAVTHNGVFLMDFERTAVGPPEWDLTSTAVAADTFGKIPRSVYEKFCESYGHDVMAWAGYPTLREIRELRLTSFALQTADDNPAMLKQARYRVKCVRGLAGPRPWHWKAVA
ncbi:aminoglycoside phosphotransferase family protein [Streptomyces fulvoviolaceus]|uniref:aminoglycoside phosphotransferase family protein n=1 Tax=Streptomyces fulvoviolaceus TaxID=285535 RepID=UPI0021C18038|nr:aminoglycoside phosphotransferase family protein [Streptomyces fulvoviolaceus]MCT9075337.1 aminoglycoside phosphotransferase family protein [Streptomyces fulvoviolaceus]